MAWFSYRLFQMVGAVAASPATPRLRTVYWSSHFFRTRYSKAFSEMLSGAGLPSSMS
jgi:hypothetical protein